MNAPKQPLILRNVRFGWPGPDGFELNVPHFEVGRGESVFLQGRSGGGKTTLLSLICGINVPQAGSVVIADQELGSLSSRRRDRHRADHIGVIFQQFNLLPYASAVENVLLALAFADLRARRVGDRAACRREAGKLLGDLGITINDQYRSAGKLSVGQQQRVAAARALIGDPTVIVADEPTSSMDEETENQFLDVLFAQVQARNTSLLLVSHDSRLAARFDRTVQLDEIVETNQQPAGVTA